MVAAIIGAILQTEIERFIQLLENNDYDVNEIVDDLEYAMEPEFRWV